MSNNRDPRTEELEDINDVMANVQGRRMMYRFLSQAGIYKTTYSKDAPEHNIFFREGMRNLGLWILNEVQESSPELYLKMLKEENDNVN